MEPSEHSPSTGFPPGWHERVYAHRFRGIDTSRKSAAWRPIAAFIEAKLGSPAVLLDPAAGMCEFVNHARARERWAVDAAESTRDRAAHGVHVLIGSSTAIDLPPARFDAVFVSNFLEHLDDQEEVARFLRRMHAALRPGGRIALMGPNFRACPREYFDFADHKVLLTEQSAAEHLVGADFEVREVHARFLPLTFRQKLPISPVFVSAYLALPFAWRFFGKQFLLFGEKRG